MGSAVSEKLMDYAATHERSDRTDHARKVLSYFDGRQLLDLLLEGGVLENTWAEQEE